MDFLTTVFLYLVVTLALKKILGLVLAWKSGLKVPFLPFGRSCPLKTILLSDLVGCDSPLRTILFSRGLSHPTGGAALPSDNISGRFFKGGETLC